MTLYHPRNSKLTFNEEKHVYYVDGKPCIYSVSKFVTKFVGEFERDKKIEQLQILKKEGKLKNSLYGSMSSEEISDYWTMRQKDGTKIHLLIENFYIKKEIFSNKSHKLYPDFEKFLEFQDSLIRDGWKNFGSEFRLFCDNPFIGGMVDLIVWKRNKFGEYEYNIIDWKRCRSVSFVDKKKDLSYIDKEKKIESPLKGKVYSTWLKHSLQIHVYFYIIKKYYAKDFFLFQPNQKFKLLNVYFNDKFKSYYVRQCINLSREVEQMFEMVKKGII